MKLEILQNQVLQLNPVIEEQQSRLSYWLFQPQEQLRKTSGRDWSLPVMISLWQVFNRSRNWSKSSIKRRSVSRRWTCFWSALHATPISFHSLGASPHSFQECFGFSQAGGLHDSPLMSQILLSIVDTIILCCLSQPAFVAERARACRSWLV